MANEDVDQERRRFLVTASSVVGGAGVVALGYPFIAAWKPSAQAQAAGAPVEVNISQMEPGQLIRVQWRGQPVWILKRSEDMLATLPKLEPRLADPNSAASIQPEYAHNEYRSIDPEIAVMIGLCTHLGCTPNYRPDVAPDDLGPDWLGGFFCACHGSYFDYAGRVYRNNPAPTNLPVPPHMYLSDAVILIGEDEGVA